MPHVAKLSSEIPDLKVIGISLDDPGNAAKVKDTLKKNGIAAANAIDAKQTAADNYGIASIPFSMLINPEGLVVMKGVRGEGMFAAIKGAMAG